MGGAGFVLRWRARIVCALAREEEMISLATFAAVLCILHLCGVEAQENNAASEFFLAFSKNHRFGYYDTLSLVISTPESEPVSYVVSSPYGYYTTGTVYPSSYAYLYPYSSMTVDSDSDRNKGIWVRATDPSKTLVVSGMNYETYTADTFLALPTGPAREEYTYITNSMLWTNRTGNTFPSLILIVGTQDNTVLTITPTEYVIIPYDLRDPSNPQYYAHPGQSYSVTLNQLQTYQIESNLDLTGSRIVSNKPLSVFAGHECTDVPGGVTACDHLFEQVPPTHTWGRFFFLVPSESTYRTSPEWYRIVSSKQSTTVSITCFSLDNSLHTFSYHAYIGPLGGFEQFQMEQDNYCYVSVDKPVLVMQYAYGGSSNNYGYGDPFMMMILPNEQYVTNATIQFYAFSYFTSDITIVVLQQESPSGSVILDGVPLVSNWVPLYCAEGELCGYTLRRDINDAFHSLRHTNNLVPVAVYVYGFDYYQGYGHPAAMALRNLEVLECSDGEVRLVDGDTTTEGRVEVCQGGVWGTVCNDHWTPQDTDVVCGELGLLSSGVTDRFYGEGEGPILLDNVECLGVESTVLECLYDPHTSDCSHSQDAGAVCLPYPEPVIQLEQSPPNMTQYYAGYDLALSCLVSVSPEVVGRVSITATWSKDDREYSNNWDSRISVSPPSLTSDDGVYATSLSFTPLDSRDTGSYQCMAVLTSYTGVPLANATVTTSLTVEDLPQTFVQLHLLGVEDCYQWMQSATGSGADSSVAAAVGTGVEGLCDCGFSSNNLHQIILQCFPDNPTKINLLMLLQGTPSKTTSEIVSYLTMWIASGPQIVLDERNTTVGINKDCDITVIQGSECATPPTSPQMSPSPSPSNQATNESPDVSSAAQSSNGRDLTAAGGVLVAIALVAVAVCVVVVIFVLVRYRVVNIRSFSLRDRIRQVRDIRIFYRKAKVPEQFEGDKQELTKDDGCDEPTVVVGTAALTDQNQ